jgi:hypothetical protein
LELVVVVAAASNQKLQGTLNPKPEYFSKEIHLIQKHLELVVVVAAA